LRYLNILRAFEARSPTGRYGNWNPEFGYLQRPLGSPSVFNFFKPGYQLPGPIRNQGLVSPEFQITSETTVISVANEMNEAINRGHHLANHWNDNMPRLQLQRELLLIDNPSALLDHLDLLLFSGQMSAQTRATALNLLNDISQESAITRLASVIYVLVLSPDFVVQR
jgi:hypothetical protein